MRVADVDERPRIAILPPAVADAIAAGEVVDRPAAVVKELVENALDAEAARVSIRVQGAGRSLVEVVDDGGGILPDDLPLAFQRHATSKIHDLAGMRTIRTLGFRGEALASIAAVAEVEAVSRARGRGEGYRVLVEGGELKQQGPAGSPGGTRIGVRHLFFNTPARLHFLKQPATENAVIVRLVSELALARPQIALRLEVDGRRTLQTTGSGDLRTAFASLYDAQTAGAMLELTDPMVSGLISPPSLHRATRDHIVILVNGRRIHHRSLAFAVEQAYRGLRDPDRFPLAIVDVRLDPEDVDVNVHPTKREVRFRNEREVFAALERACFHALRRSPLYEVQAGAAGDGLVLRETPLVTAPSRPPPSAVSGERPKLPPLGYVGQLLRAYLVAESEDAVVLVDQHAAHERVLFDRILPRLQQQRSAGQLLLLSQVVELTPAQAAAFEEHQDWLRTLGFDGEPFGSQTIRLTAAPVELPEKAVADVVARLLDDLDRERTPELRLHETAALLACHSAVRFGDAMLPEAARELLAALSLTAEPVSCPHGRPTTLVLPDDQLRRLFKRP